ncbi:MAG: hypothetical protein R3F53_05355 [Gammaproteobacteria bacterium]
MNIGVLSVVSVRHYRQTLHYSGTAHPNCREGGQWGQQADSDAM